MKKEKVVDKVKAAVCDENIFHLQAQIKSQNEDIDDLKKRLSKWRALGKAHGPVSPHELINQALIELKAIGEI